MLLEILSTIILHNSLAKESRDFVSTIPEGADVQVIDWYQDESARFKYTGPPPSAFPSAIIEVPAHAETVTDMHGKEYIESVPDTQGTLRLPKSWDGVIEAQESPIGKCETMVEPFKHIGGVTVNEARALKDRAELRGAAKQAIEETLQTIDAK